MKTMKTFFKFAIIFVVMYFVFDLLTFAYLKTTYLKVDNYTISINEPEVTIKESRATKLNGYIKGTITNNTDKDIETLYLKADLTSKKDNYLGYESMEIKNLKVGETREFELEYRFANVGSFVLSKTDVLDQKTKVIDIDMNDPATKYLLLTSLLYFIYKTTLIP